MDRSERFHNIDRLLKDRLIVPMQLFLEELEVSRAIVKRAIKYMVYVRTKLKLKLTIHLLSINKASVSGSA